MNNRKTNVLRLVQGALLTALVVVLQFMGSFIKIGPLPMSFVLVPIVIGAFLLGPKTGAFLGGVFGVITAAMGIFGVDAFSAMLFAANPIFFVVICLLKAIAAGFGAGLIYKAWQMAFKGKYMTVITVIAAVSAPIINTGVFAAGMLLFFNDTMASLIPAFAQQGYTNTLQVVFLGLAGVNFIGEFLVNLVLSPAIVRVIDIVRTKIRIH